MPFFEKSNAPDHVEDCGGNKEETRNYAAEYRLRVFEDNLQGSQSFIDPVGVGGDWLLPREQDKEGGGDHNANESHTAPKSVWGKSARDHRSHEELSRRSTGGAEHLSGAYESGG